MMAAHVGFTTCGLTSLSGVLNQAHGRSAVLFAVIAGFSLGIMSGRTRPHTGEALVRTRLRILVRCALLLVLGTCLAVLGPPVGVILGYYAAWLALALPFLAWRPQSLFVLAAVTAAVGPVIKIGLPVVLDSLGMTAQPFLTDGNIAVISVLLTGLYPGALWMAYIFLGLGLSRLDWSRSRNLWRLAAVGVLCAVVGYGGGWAASSVAAPDGPDPYHLVSPAEPAQCSTGPGRLDPAVGRSGRAGSSVGPDAAGFGTGTTPEPAAGPAPSRGVGPGPPAGRGGGGRRPPPTRSRPRPGTAKASTPAAGRGPSARPHPSPSSPWPPRARTRTRPSRRWAPAARPWSPSLFFSFSPAVCAG